MQTKTGILFSIKVPMASWSEGGASLRPSEMTPTWSGVAGLIAAAFGWKRDDGRISKFASDYAMAVQVHEYGFRLLDYHTVQSPERSKSDKLRSRTRFEELSVDTVHTTITRREYVTDAHYDFVLLAVVNSPVVLPIEIRDALLNPHFPLYVGRRSCPVGQVFARCQEGSLDTLLPDATHWDARLSSTRVPSLIRERRDLRSTGMTYLTRQECVA